MLDATTSLTVQARVPNPYVHVDNRGLILCNGPRCVCVPGVPAAHLRGDVRDHRHREARDARAGPAPGGRLHRRRVRRRCTRGPWTISSRSA